MTSTSRAGTAGWAAGDELEVAERGEEGGAAALVVLPAFAGLEAERAEEAGELVEGLLRGRRR